MRRRAPAQQRYHADRLLLIVAALAAEMERELIRERTLDGLRPPAVAGAAAAGRWTYVAGVKRVTIGCPDRRAAAAAFCGGEILRLVAIWATRPATLSACSCRAFADAMRDFPLLAFRFFVSVLTTARPSR